MKRTAELEVPPELVAQVEEIKQTSDNRRLMLDDSGCWAKQEEDQIRIYNKDGGMLLGLKPEIIPFEKKPLALVLQVYLMGYNTGKSAGMQEVKTKVTELIRLAL